MIRDPEDFSKIDSLKEIRYWQQYFKSIIFGMLTLPWIFPPLFIYLDYYLNKGALDVWSIIVKNWNSFITNPSYELLVLAVFFMVVVPLFCRYRLYLLSIREKELLQEKKSS